MAIKPTTYIAGEEVGPYGIIFLEETEPYISPKGRRERKAKFKCFCGKEFISKISLVKCGRKKSCGCLNVIDLSNQVFGKLHPLYALEERAFGGSVIWHCKCECGNEVDVKAGNLTSGNTKSCGCLNVKDFKNKKFGFLTALYPTFKRNKFGRGVWEVIITETTCMHL